MMNIFVSKKALREYIHEAMSSPGVGWQATGDLSTSPANISAVVDPSAATTDPGNPKFKPRNRVELKTALSAMIDDIADDDASNFYADMKTVIKTKEEEGEKNVKNNNRKTENAVRLSVRKMLREIGQYRDTGMSYSGPMTGSPAMKPGIVDCQACDGEGILEDGTDCTVCDGKGEVEKKGRTNATTNDVGGESFANIASELGYKTASGAKQELGRALAKYKYMWSLEPDEFEIVMLQSMNDYIEYLQDSGELTASDVQLMKDHPNIVSELDGFKEFLGKKIRNFMKQAGSTDEMPVESKQRHHERLVAEALASVNHKSCSHNGCRTSQGVTQRRPHSRKLPTRSR